MSRQSFAAFAAIIVTACAIVAAAVWAPPRSPDRAVRAPLAAEPPPPVEPVSYRAVTAESAREINAAIPFAAVANPAAPRFAITSDSTALPRATDCLAAAGYYEAGDDVEGQRSVMQVILNRLRHPAFPKSVCGVVFQGSDRVTGCQFTFTCDGALGARRPSEAAWARARTTALEALSGRVYAPVGVATHYHTDWVVPYWSSSLLKLTKVYTHLFFRWPGGWGSRAALNGRYAGAEPAIAKLAALSPSHLPGEEEVALDVLLADVMLDTPGTLTPAVKTLLFRSDEDFLVLIKPGSSAHNLGLMARALCGRQEFCKVRGWTDAAAAPTALPVSAAAQGKMAFSFLRDTKRSFEKTLWNCSVYQRSDDDQCIKGTAPKRDARANANETPPSPLRPTSRIALSKPEDAVNPSEARAVVESKERRRPGQGN